MMKMNGTEDPAILEGDASSILQSKKDTNAVRIQTCIRDHAENAGHAQVNAKRRFARQLEQRYSSHAVQQPRSFFLQPQQLSPVFVAATVRARKTSTRAIAAPVTSGRNRRTIASTSGSSGI